MRTRIRLQSYTRSYFPRVLRERWDGGGSGGSGPGQSASAYAIERSAQFRNARYYLFSTIFYIILHLFSPLACLFGLATRPSECCTSRLLLSKEKSQIFPICANHRLPGLYIVTFNRYPCCHELRFCRQIAVVCLKQARDYEAILFERLPISSCILFACTTTIRFFVIFNQSFVIN